MPRRPCAGCASDCTPPSASVRRSPPRPTALGRALDVQNAAAELVGAAGRASAASLGDAVKVTPGYEAAIAAALGRSPRACWSRRATTPSPSRARARRRPRGRRHRDRGRRCAQPASRDSRRIVAARDVVTAPTGVLGILSHVVIADDLDAARVAAPRLAGCRARRARSRSSRASGEVVTEHTAAAGSGQGRSRLELAASGMPPPSAAPRSSVVADSLREALADAAHDARGARQRTKAALSTLREHDAALAAHTEQVEPRDRAARGGGRGVRAARGGCSRRRRPRSRTPRSPREPPATSSQSRSRRRDRSSTRRRARACSRALETARDGEMRARLDVETLRERIRAGEARVVQLERQREREREAAAEAARRAVIRRAQREVAAAVAAQLPAVLDSVDRSVSQARVELADGRVGAHRA